MAQTLGELIREQRLARGLSLGQLASAVSRSPSSVRRWERGEAMPAEKHLEALAGALGLDAAELLDVALAEKADAETELPQPEPEPAPPGQPEVDEGSLLTAQPGQSWPDEPIDDRAQDPVIEAEPESPTELVSAASGVSLSSVSPPAVDPATVVAAEPTDATAETAIEMPVLEAAPSPLEEPVGREPVPASWAPVVDVKEAKPPRPIPLRYPESVPAGVAVEITEPAPNPWNPLRYLYDPDKPWLYWVRAGLTVIVLLILLNVLVDSVGELFDKIGEVIDSIESTEPAVGDEVLP